MATQQHNTGTHDNNPTRPHQKTQHSKISALNNNMSHMLNVIAQPNYTTHSPTQRATKYNNTPHRHNAIAQRNKATKTQTKNITTQHQYTTK